MRCVSISSTASAASVSGRTVFAWRVMTCSMRVPCRSTARSKARRRSPSVNTPSTRFASSTTAVMPRPLRVTSIKSFGERRIRRHFRHLRAGAHHVLDVQQQTPAQCAGRMGAGEILLGESACLEQRHRERIAHGQGRRGAGRGREVERTRFGRHADVQMHGRDTRQRRGRIAGKGDQRHAQTLDRRHEGQDFIRFPGIGQGEHRVVAGDHADVAVARLTGMHEKGRSPGAGQGGGDLAADMARFAHARHGNSATAGKTNAAGACKLPPQAGHLSAQTVDLYGERLAAEIDEA